MHCPNCHAAAGLSARYCHLCGIRLTTDGNDERADRQRAHGSHLRSHEPHAPHAVHGTRRHLPNETLSPENRYYAALFEQSAVGVAQIESHAGRFHRINQRYCDMVGYTPDEMLAMDLQIITHPDDLDLNLENLARLRAGGIRQFHVEKRYLAKNGTAVWVRKTVLPLWSHGEAPDFYLVFVDDITDRKLAEEALRRSEERFRSVVEDQTDMILRWNLAGNVSFVNEAVCRYLNLPREEVLGKPFLPYIYKDDLPTLLAHHQSLTPERPVGSIEYRLAVRDDVRWVHCTNRAIFSTAGQRIEVQSAKRDITERKRLEQSLRLTQFSIDRSIDSVYWVGPNAEILYANDATCRILGYSREEFVGRTIFDIDPGYSTETWSAHWEELKQQGKLSIESVRRTKDGDLINIEVTANYISFEGREYGCATLRDITQRKRLEQSLRLTQFSVDCAVDSVFWVAPNAEILYVNEATCRMLGYSRDELVGKTTFEFNPTLSREAWSAYWEDLRQRKAFSFESVQRTKDGNLIDTEFTVNYITFEGHEYSCATMRDITERKRLEKSLRLTQFSVDHAVDLLFWVGPNAEVLYVNEASCRILGYSSAELVGKTLFEIAPTYLPEVWSAHWEELKRQGNLYVESVQRTKDGNLINVEVNANYLSFEGREYGCATLRDITERKRLEQSLRLTQFSVDRAVDAVFWVGSNAEILYVNEATCRMLGHSREELIGKTSFDLNPTLSREAWSAYWEELKQRRDLFFESVQRTKDDKLIDTEITVSYINFEGREYSCGTTRDISQRKQAERLLLQSEERFRQITQAIQEAFWIASVDTTEVHYISPAYELIWGRPCQSVIDSPQTFLDSIHREDRDRVVASLVAKSEGMPFEHEYRIVRPDGSIRWILDRGFPVQPTAMTEACYVGVAQDITRRKEAELQASMLRDELAHVARAGTISELATGLAHELNQPLTSLCLYAGTALELITSSESTALKDCLQRVVDLSLRAGEIVRRMRSFVSRGSSRRERANINRLVDEVLSLLEGDLKKSGTKTNFVAGKRIPAVLVDGVQIQQVLVNLIRNALEAMPVGSQDRPASLTIHTRSIDGSVRVSVTDSGCGLDPAIADKLFHPFQTTKPTGLGLGLAICRTLIEAQGGRIGANSNPSGGMTFFFLLPAARDQPVPNASSNSSEV